MSDVGDAVTHVLLYDTRLVAIGTINFYECELAAAALAGGKQFALKAPCRRCARCATE